jgi:hypothetical protein
LCLLIIEEDVNHSFRIDNDIGIRSKHGNLRNVLDSKWIAVMTSGDATWKAFFLLGPKSLAKCTEFFLPRIKLIVLFFFFKIRLTTAVAIWQRHTLKHCAFLDLQRLLTTLKRAPYTSSGENCCRLFGRSFFPPRRSPVSIAHELRHSYTVEITSIMLMRTKSISNATITTSRIIIVYVENLHC